MIVLRVVHPDDGPYLIACGKHSRVDKETFPKAVRSAWKALHDGLDHCAIFSTATGQKVAELDRVARERGEVDVRHGRAIEVRGGEIIRLRRPAVHQGAFAARFA